MEFKNAVMAHITAHSWNSHIDHGLKTDLHLVQAICSNSLETYIWGPELIFHKKEDTFLFVHAHLLVPLF